MVAESIAAGVGLELRFGARDAPKAAALDVRDNRIRR